MIFHNLKYNSLKEFYLIYFQDKIQIRIIAYIINMDFLVINNCIRIDDKEVI